MASNPPFNFSAASLGAVLAFLTMLFATGEAIQCYACTSMKDPGCGDPFQANANVPTVTCSPDAIKQWVNDASHALKDVMSKFGVDVPASTMELAFVCQKVKGADKNGDEVVFRSCAFNPDTVNSCPPANTGAQCWQCNGDLCNAAPSAAGAPLFALVALPVAVLRVLRP